MPRLKRTSLATVATLLLLTGVASAHYVNSRWPNCSTSVPFNVPFNDTWIAEITSAMDAWNAVDSCVPLSIADSGTTTKNDMMAVTDNTRTDVAWATRTYSYNIFGPNKTTEVDITYNTRYTYSTSPTSGKWDIQSVVAHELGHAIGLGHNDDTPACSTSDTATWPTCATMGNNWGSGITHPRSLESHDETDKEGLY